MSGLIFSIIIPTFNRAGIIRNAIESVLNQTFDNWELIIVDDSSVDNTEKVIKDNFKDKRIAYYKLPKNKGNAGARNKGVEVSQGDYIVFLDSDDKMEPNCLEDFIKLIWDKPDVHFAFGDHQIFNKTSGEIKRSNWIPNPNISFLEELKIGTGCGIMVKKNCFDEVGYFDERLRIAVDTDWLIRLNQKVDYVYLPKILITVIKHDNDRVRNNKLELIKSYEIILNKQKDKIFKNRKLIKKFFYKLQWLNYHEGNLKEGNKYAINLIKEKVYDLKSFITAAIFNIFPKRLGKQIHLLLSGGEKI